ncbi:recombinase family protein [Pinisolibacter sp.]|uniref:recombinase family protein n=1 Tax=Pinisolibacter sp. TaxID=2172024 RepID=UPI003FA6C735
MAEWGRPTEGNTERAKRIRAAEYVRMSTEHQQYSTENQADAIRRYAAAHAIDIVKTYADEGKSGLRIEGRNGLKLLLDDIVTGRADFETVLVYDVSRWGRFQDADESAYYEYICRRAGIAILYCAEQFPNDGSPMSTVMKGLKRAMAGEYSRELSTKVFAGQRRLIEHGYRQGGPAGFGLRRVLIDQAGSIKGELNRGEQKSIHTDRVVLRPGPEPEIAVIAQIYRTFVATGKTERQIADELNAQAIPTDLGRPWTRGTVHQVLINEKYIGNNVWNRMSFKLKQKRIRNEPSAWIRADGAFPGIIDRNLYDAAQSIIQARSFRLSDEEMLAGLRGLFEACGTLSGIVIDEAEGLPSSSSYRSRFGSLLRAYGLVGYSPRRDYRYIEINRALRRLHPTIVADIVNGLTSVGAVVAQNVETDMITVNGEFSASVVIGRCRQLPSGTLRWRLRLDTGRRPDITVAVRLDAQNRHPVDFYLLPRIDVAALQLNLAEDNGLGLDGYRFDSLDILYDLATPTRLTEVA